MGSRFFFQPQDEEDLSFFLSNMIQYPYFNSYVQFNYKDNWYSWYRNKAWQNFSKIKYNKNDISVGQDVEIHFAQICAKMVDFSFKNNFGNNLVVLSK